MNRKNFPYFNMYDGSEISFEHWTNDLSVDLHRHNFHELLIVERGTCRHIFNAVETLLIPGDCVIIGSHREHGFMMSGEVSIFNCQFKFATLEENLRKFLTDSFLQKNNRGEELPDWEKFLTEREKLYRKNIFEHGSYELNSNKQGVIHLPPNGQAFIKSILYRGLHEQLHSDDCSNFIKRRCLEIILLELKRAMKFHLQQYNLHTHAHQKIMAEVLLYIDAHLTEQIDFEELAAKYAFSLNYFRKLFRDVTGFSPVNYLNRLRIVRSCEYIQRENLSVGEAAERVGIYDANYFSRLFKKIMGTSPSHLQNF